MNQFQVEGRYPDYRKHFYKSYKAVETKKGFGRGENHKKMLTQRSVINQIKRFAGDVKQSGIQLNKVMLFGSFAKNEQHQWGDIDVALVADEFTGVGFEDTRLFSRILVEYLELNIQPHTYNTKDFSPEKDPFVEETLKTGIEIEV